MLLIPSATISEVGSQLVSAYQKTNREFQGNPGKMNDAWDETVEQLRTFDPTTPNINQLLEVHAYLSILEQIVFVAGQQNGSQ